MACGGQGIQILGITLQRISLQDPVSEKPWTSLSLRFYFSLTITFLRDTTEGPEFPPHRFGFCLKLFQAILPLRTTSLFQRLKEEICRSVSRERRAQEVKCGPALRCGS